MAFVYFVINKRGMVAAMMLGVAFAFKLQTIFIGPFVLYCSLPTVGQGAALARAPAGASDVFSVDGPGCPCGARLG